MPVPTGLPRTFPESIGKNAASIVGVVFLRAVAVRVILLTILVGGVSTLEAQSQRVPSAIIGGDAGDSGVELAGLGRVVIDRYLRIYVLDSAEARVLVFDSVGRQLFVLGRKGDGPGEFRNPWAMTLEGRTHLVVLDAGRRKFVRFDVSTPQTVRFLDEIVTPVVGGAMCVFANHAIVLDKGGGPNALYDVQLAPNPGKIVRSFGAANVLHRDGRNPIVRHVVIGEGAIGCDEGSGLVVFAAVGQAQYHVLDPVTGKVTSVRIPAFDELVLEPYPGGIQPKAGPSGSVMFVTDLVINRAGGVQLQTSIEQRSDYNAARAGPSQYRWFSPSGQEIRRGPLSTTRRMAFTSSMIVCGREAPVPTLLVFRVSDRDASCP